MPVEISSRIVQPGNLSKVSIPVDSKILGVRRRSTGGFFNGGVVLDYLYSPPGTERKTVHVESICQGIVTLSEPGQYLGCLEHGSNTYFFFLKEIENESDSEG